MEVNYPGIEKYAFSFTRSCFVASNFNLFDILVLALLPVTLLVAQNLWAILAKCTAACPIVRNCELIWL
jgi:hypothetical protein